MLGKWAKIHEALTFSPNCFNLSIAICYHLTTQVDLVFHSLPAVARNRQTVDTAKHCLCWILWPILLTVSSNVDRLKCQTSAESASKHHFTATKPMLFILIKVFWLKYYSAAKLAAIRILLTALPTFRWSRSNGTTKAFLKCVFWRAQHGAGIAQRSETVGKFRSTAHRSPNNLRFSDRE